MEYIDDQDQEITHYRLYCLNTKCKTSIYNHPEEIEVPFDAENLSATHLCHCCDKPLVSKMDMEIKKVMLEIETRITMPRPVVMKMEKIRFRF